MYYEYGLVAMQIATGKWIPRHDTLLDATQPRTEFPSFTPAIFINMIIAITLDYNLFILTRYREELLKGKPNIDAVTVALKRAGRVVFVSGVTLGLTNIGLTFCPVTVVNAIGWGGAVSCTVAVAVHLTLLPSLLVLLGPPCQAAMGWWRRQCGNSYCLTSPVALPVVDGEVDVVEVGGLPGPACKTEAEEDCPLHESLIPHDDDPERSGGLLLGWVVRGVMAMHHGAVWLVPGQSAYLGLGRWCRDHRGAYSQSQP